MDVVFPCFSYWIQSDSGPLKHGARLFTGVQIVGVGQGGAQLTSHLRWGMDPSDPKGPKGTEQLQHLNIAAEILDRLRCIFKFQFLTSSAEVSWNISPLNHMFCHY